MLTYKYIFLYVFRRVTQTHTPYTHYFHLAYTIAADAKSNRIPVMCLWRGAGNYYGEKKTLSSQKRGLSGYLVYQVLVR